MSTPSNEPSPQPASDSSGVDVSEFEQLGRPVDAVDEADIRFGESQPSVDVSSNDLPSTTSDAAFTRVRPKNTKRSSRLLLTVLLIGLVVGIVAGSWFASSFWSWQSRSRQQVTERFREHPIVIEQLGGIDQCSFSLFETAGPDVDENNVVAFKVQGSKRFGFIYIRSSTGEPKDAEWAGLKVGKEFWRLEND